MAAEANLGLKKNVSGLLIIWSRYEKLRDDSRSDDARW